MRRILSRARSLGLVILLLGSSAQAQAQPIPDHQQVAMNFVNILLHERTGDTWPYFNFIKDTWQPGYVPMLLETWSLARLPETARRVITLLREKTGQPLNHEVSNWFQWWWNQPHAQHGAYPVFKSTLYGFLDPRFTRYFTPDPPTRIRLDEVRWGGVKQDGIPPLRQPAMIPASEASYLADDHVVFGVEINGDARAYPKRILAWHEMFVDTIGGINFAGVYCTLCGAVILYETEFNGVNHQLGTSGFLFRSNKLMYDKATQSLWNTTWGEPVVGFLADYDIRLKRSYVVTTTWGEWKRRHPDTQVLSINTGFLRNYDEGVAYQDYFARDDLMFNVPELDERLNNKDEVLALVFPESGDQQLAIDANFLAANQVYQDKLGAQPFVVLTDTSGANRVYQADTITFDRYDGDATVVDSAGNDWTLSEDKLTAQDGQALARLPAHRAFWFGWFANYPDTRLVK